MTSTPVTFADCKNDFDARGSSFLLHNHVCGFLKHVKNIHIATINPGEIRGNHFHTHMREIIFVMSGSAWTLHWDTGENTELHEQRFSGTESVVLKILPGASHAITNTGSVSLLLVSLSDRAYNRSEPDVSRRQVTPN